MESPTARDKDFNVEGKESKLNEQRRLQLKRMKDWENVEDQGRRAAETEQQSEALRLQRKRRQRKTFSAETEQQREIRLIRLSDNQGQMLERESREVRVDRVKANQRERLARESNVTYIQTLSTTIWLHVWCSRRLAPWMFKHHL